MSGIVIIYSRCTFIRIMIVYNISGHSNVTGGQCTASILAGPAQRSQEMDPGAPTRVLLPVQPSGGYRRAGRDQ
jgi:hypothetical protein